MCRRPTRDLRDKSLSLEFCGFHYFHLCQGEEVGYVPRINVSFLPHGSVVGIKSA